MKIVFLNICLMFALQSIAQQSEDQGQKLSVGTQSKSETTHATTAPIRVRTLKDVENDIANIEVKLAWMKQNPEEDKRAKEEGWYDAMNAKLTYLKAEREKHLTKTK